jgi:WD40 repeat protein/serine/threonine protein kinase
MRRPSAHTSASFAVLLSAPMADGPIAHLAGRKLGDFILREPIGEGGYAVVYRCEQQQLRRSAVIKVLHERGQRSDAALDRFRREALLASQLDHPYAAHVYAFGDEDDGLFWIAMELVHGIALDDWLEAHGPMPLAQFVPFFERVADVVHAAHERGIIHRDLKPSNVMVIERNGRLFPKLLDFGIAKLTGEAGPPLPEHPSGTEKVPTEPLRAARRRAPRTRTDPAAQDHRLTGTSAKLGSTAYMSPEQWSHPEAVGPASDIYSLGILAYEVLTGRKPFTAESTHEYYHQHVYAEVPPLGDGFPPEVDRVIRRALAKAPEARHGNVLELAAALRAALQRQPHEQLRSLAQVWDARARSPELLVKSKDLLRAPSAVVGQLERAFVTESRRHAARRARLRRALVGIAAMLALGAVWYRGKLQTELAEQQARGARQVAEATIEQSELEQGRAALLHNEPEALPHLAEAYRRAPSGSTAFMLARAMQPRLAEQARFESSSGRMWSAAFSPDGTQIVTTDDQNAQVWDAQTYRLRFTLPHGHEVYHAVYRSDGGRIVTAAEDAVRIWDAATGALVYKLTQQRGDGSPTDSFVVAMSSDGRLVAALDAAGSFVQVWDAVRGTPIAHLASDASKFPGLTFSADGRWLATTGGNDVYVFDTRTWQRALTIRGLRVRSLAFDPTAPRLVTGGTTGDVAIWDVPNRTRLRHLRELGEPVDAVAFSPDGQLIAAACRDGSAQVWRASSGALQSQFQARHSKIVMVEFDPASRLVLAAGGDGAAVVADAFQGMPIAILEGPHAMLHVAHFAPNSQRVIGASWDGTARLWDSTSPYRRWSSPPVSDDCGIVTTAEPDRRFLAIGCDDQGTHVWDTARGELLAELPGVSRVEGDFSSAFPAVSSAGDRAAIARGNGVEVYELPGGRLLRTIPHAAPVNAVAFADRARDILSGAVDGSLLVTRDSGAQLALPTAPGGIDAVGFLPDGRIVASDAQRRLRVYDPTGAPLADIALPVRVMSLRPDGSRLVAIPRFTGNATPPLLVDLERYRITAELKGHIGRVFSARWMPDGQILTASADGTARLWNGSTGQPTQSFQGSSRFLFDATLTSDGLLVAGGADGLLRFWDAASGRLLWMLPAHKSWIVGVHLEGNDIVTRGYTGEVSRWTLPSPHEVIQACRDLERCTKVKP